MHVLVPFALAAPLFYLTYFNLQDADTRTEVYWTYVYTYRRNLTPISPDSKWILLVIMMTLNDDTSKEKAPENIFLLKWTHYTSLPELKSLFMLIERVGQTAASERGPQWRQLQGF